MCRDLCRVLWESGTQNTALVLQNCVCEVQIGWHGAQCVMQAAKVNQPECNSHECALITCNLYHILCTFAHNLCVVLVQDVDERPRLR